MIVSDLDMRYRKKIIPGRPLLTCGIELTSYCNLRCIHCYIRSDNNGLRHKELNTKQVLNILEQIREAGVVYLTLTGGEPLLRQDFKDIYLFAKKQKFAVTINTNATLITKDIVELFKKHPPLTLSISCYGIIQDTYESITGIPGSFAMFQKAISMIKGSRINALIKFITMKNNYKEAGEAEAFAKRMGMSYMCSYSLWLRLDRDKLKNVIIKKQRLNAEETIDLFNIMGEDLKKFYSSFPECGSVAGCGAASIGCVVDSYGWLMPCFYFGEHRISLKKMDFKKAWELLALRKSPVIKKQLACGNCRHKIYCKWCPGASYLETGNSEKKIRYLCRLMDTFSERKIIGCQ